MTADATLARGGLLFVAVGSTSVRIYGAGGTACVEHDRQTALEIAQFIQRELSNPARVAGPGA